MKLKLPARLFWVCGVLVVAALACQNTLTPGGSATATPSGSGGAQAPSPQGETAGAPGDLPAKRADQGGDVDSSTDAKHKAVPGGDIFVAGLYERPLNANTMDTYFPYIDIVNFQGYKDATWGYGAITLNNTDANGKLPAKYGVELDLNKDGRGDWLILASAPDSTTWTTQGVKAWTDTDGDVGGGTPMYADKNTSNGDGYEALAFDQGSGKNPDDVWVRIASGDKETIDIAFKLSMLGNPESFAMGAWAGTDALDPSKFDFNDHMTHAAAGSPLLTYKVYPLKQLAEIDNTCRLAIAFPASGKVPGLCYVIQQQQGDASPTSEPTDVPPEILK